MYFGTHCRNGTNAMNLRELLNMDIYIIEFNSVLTLNMDIYIIEFNSVLTFEHGYIYNRIQFCFNF